MTKHTRRRGVGLAPAFMLGLGALLAWPAAAAGRERVALVVEAAGQALVSRGDSTRPLQLLEWLTSGSRIETHAGGQARLVWRDGTRYEISGEARAVVRRDGLRPGRGVRTLTSLPAFPRELFAPLRSADRPGARAAAVRVRGPELRGLLPAAGSWVVPEERLELSFTPSPGVLNYELEVQSSDGRVVYAGRVEPGAAVVPAGSLRAAESYYWLVRGSVAVGGTAQGGSTFRTLCEADVRARRALQGATNMEPDGDAALALAAVESELGHPAEAHRLRERVAQARGDGAGAR